MSHRARTAPWFVLAGACLWGTTGTAQSLGPDASAPLQVGALRIIVGAAVLGLALVSPTGRRATRRLLGRTTLGPLLVAVGAIAAYQVCFFAGVDATGVAIGTLVGIGSAPVVTGLIAAAAGDPPTRKWSVGTGVTIAGAGVLLAGRGGTTVDGTGVALAIGAGAAYAAYTVATKRLLDAGSTPVAAMTASWVGGAVLLAPFLVGADLEWVGASDGIALVAWLGVVTVAVAYVLYAYGLRDLSAPVVASLTLAEPLTATVLAVVLLDERFTGATALGAGLLALGLIIVSVRRSGPTGTTAPVGRVRPDAME